MRRNGRERLQVFDFAGKWIAGFTLPGRAQTRVSIDGLALGGVGTLAFLGNGIALNQPETGALITEYGLAARRCAASAHCARPGTRPTGNCTSR